MGNFIFTSLKFIFKSKTTVLNNFNQVHNLINQIIFNLVPYYNFQIVQDNLTKFNLQVLLNLSFNNKIKHSLSYNSHKYKITSFNNNLLTSKIRYNNKININKFNNHNKYYINNLNNK